MDLDEATQKTAEQLGRPVVVFDSVLNVIAFSIHEGEADRGRTMTILNRRATPQAVELITQSRVKNSRNPVVVPAYRGVKARVLMPLRHRGRLYGYLSFSEERAVDEAVLSEYMGRLTQASSFLGAILALREIASQNDARSHRQLLTELLGGDSVVRGQAAEALIAGGYVARADRYTAVIVRERRSAVAESPSATESLPELGVEPLLRAMVRSSAFTAFGVVLEAGHAVAILPGTLDMGHVLDVVHREHGDTMIAGIGGPRASLTEMASSVREATIACDAVERAGSGDGALAEWEALGLDRLLLQLPLDAIKRTDLPDGVLRLLDTPSGIDLAATLDRYLDCGAEAQETAQRLHIHRSTLYYRLDKIREILGADLSSGIVRRELHTGLRIARLAGFWEG